MILKFRRKRWLDWRLAASLLGALLVAGCHTTRHSSAFMDVDDDAGLKKRARAHAKYATAVVHEINDEPEKALDAYNEAAILDSGNKDLVLDVSRRLIIARQPDRALKLLNLSAAQPDASGEIFARLGLVYSQLGKSQEAEAANRTAIKKSPKQIDAYRNLFGDYMQASREDDALQLLKQAGDQKDVSVEFLIGLSELYAHYLSRFPTRRNIVEPAAVMVLDRAAKMSPSSSVLQLRLADGYASMGANLKATQFYEESLVSAREIPYLRDSIRDKLAEIYLRAGSNQLAVAHLESIIQDDPSNARAYYLLGALAVDEQRWSDAAGFLDKSVLFNPGFERAYYDLANARIAAGQPGLALATLNEARIKFQRNFLMEYLFGVAFIEAKAYGQAMSHLTSAEVMANASEPSRLNEGFYFQVGMACERSGDYEQAAKYFQKAIELSPRFAAALNYLGYMWADRSENLKQAQLLIERALEVEPENEAYLDSLGWVRFKQGDLDGALKYILKAIELAAEPDAELYNHLGDVYSAMNESDKAREAWRKALSIEPDDKIRSKLDASESQ